MGEGEGREWGRSQSKREREGDPGKRTEVMTGTDRGGQGSPGPTALGWGVPGDKNGPSALVSCSFVLTDVWGHIGAHAHMGHVSTQKRHSIHSSVLTCVCKSRMRLCVHVD